MITIVKADGVAERRQIASMKQRAAENNAGIERSAREIMEAVRLGGFEAVREYSLKFDHAQPYEISQDDMKAAADRIDPSLLDALKKSAENIRAYQTELLTKSREWESPVPGGCVGQVVRGLSSVGIYVPGGKAAYPSSVLMNAVPAKVAGCGEIIMVTPPTENLNDAVLAAAWVAGVDRVIAVGGVQAVAALTYGAGFIPRVDKLVGPGNAYVAAAKRMAYGTLDIDMVAGPSEVLIIADEYADPCYTAADLLSQAEHDVMASSVLLTTSSELAQKVREEVIRQTDYLSRSEVMEQSLRDYGAIIVCDDLNQCCALANEIAPEHLEVLTQDPRSLLPHLINAGAIFLGENTPEPLGDYMAGPCHVLPTSGTARFFSPLSVESFLKKTSVLEFSRDALAEVKDGIIQMAESEHLTAHANSIKVRF